MSTFRPPPLLAQIYEMAKTDRLKAKLKSADRRRRRRPTPKASPTSEAPSSDDVSAPDVDVAEVLVTSLMEAASSSGTLRDSAVIASLRAVIAGSEPNSQEAKSLHREMTQSLAQASVSDREARLAAEELLKLAPRGSESQRPDQFLQYLSLISA